MSEEEKKAIEKLNEYALCKVNDNGYVEVSANGYKHTILNLIDDVLSHIKKQDKMIELLKTRIFVSSEEHEQILKIQEKHRNKSYEDCTIEYFEKKAEESE